MQSNAEWSPLTDEERQAVNEYHVKLKAEWIDSLHKRAEQTRTISEDGKFCECAGETRFGCSCHGFDI